jgi:hypothetical protein
MTQMTWEAAAAGVRLLMLCQAVRTMVLSSDRRGKTPSTLRGRAMHRRQALPDRPCPPQLDEPVHKFMYVLRILS